MDTGSTQKRDEAGASSVEYGLLLAGIAAVIVAIVFLFGGAVSGLFDETCGAIEHEGQLGMHCPDQP